MHRTEDSSIVVTELAEHQRSVLSSEIADWYAAYQRAWDDGDVGAIAQMTDPALSGSMIMMDGETIWKATFDAEVEGVRGFLDFAARHQVTTRHDVLDVMFRSPDEAIVVTRKTVQILDGDDPRTLTQFAIETLRRDKFGNWRLVRYWAEKARLGDTYCPQAEVEDVR
jgi:hypothetical protein